MVKKLIKQLIDIALLIVFVWLVFQIIGCFRDRYSTRKELELINSKINEYKIQLDRNDDKIKELKGRLKKSDSIIFELKQKKRYVIKKVDYSNYNDNRLHDILTGQTQCP